MPSLTFNAPNPFTCSTSSGSSTNFWWRIWCRRASHATWCVSSTLAKWKLSKASFLWTMTWRPKCACCVTSFSRCMPFPGLRRISPLRPPFRIWRSSVVSIATKGRISVIHWISRKTCPCTMVQNKKNTDEIATQSFTFPQVREWAEWAKWAKRAKQAVQSKHTSEQCERTSEWTSKCPVL